ncbi:MAG: alpha/beta fold hydrolase [Polyangiaceae bacterium]
MSIAVPVHEISLHGHTFRYRMAGAGPTLVLLHGVTCSSETWEQIIAPLAKHFTVIAPDLLGHGQSAKPTATEYSPGAYAAFVRDLLVGLDRTRVTLVGHSLGGGVAMQFSYLFPEMIERMVLVSAGGLGRELHGILRMAALPGADFVLPVVASARLRGLVDRGLGLLGKVGLRAGTDAREMWRGFGTFVDAGARRAFFHTMRTVIDAGGQRAVAIDRLYLASHMPTLIVWGEKDSILPVAHARAAHEQIAGSRLEVFAGAGHFPHLDEPFRFVSVLTDFIRTTEAARTDAASVAAAVRERAEQRTEDGKLRAA